LKHSVYKDLKLSNSAEVYLGMLTKRLKEMNVNQKAKRDGSFVYVLLTCCKLCMT